MAVDELNLLPSIKNKKMPNLAFSVLIPAYNESASLPELVERIERTFKEMESESSFEVIIVSDGSTDDTSMVVNELQRSRPWLRLLSLRRNCGKSLALMAGFREVQGALVVTLDADLQDHPEDIAALLKGGEDGNEVVVGWRQKRQDTLVRKIGSRLYNTVVKKSTGLNIHDMNCGMKMLTHEVVDTLCVYGHHHRYIPLHAYLAGFKVGEARIHNSSRKHGQSRYPAFRYQGFFDLLTILFTHHYGLNPLHFFGIISVILALPSLGVLVWLCYEQLLYIANISDIPVLSRPILSFSLTALMLSIVVFLSGFVCDFLLYHRIRERIDAILDQSLVGSRENAHVKKLNKIEAGKHD